MAARQDKSRKMNKFREALEDEINVVLSRLTDIKEEIKTSVLDVENITETEPYLKGYGSMMKKFHKYTSKIEEINLEIDMLYLNDDETGVDGNSISSEKSDAQVLNDDVSSTKSNKSQNTSALNTQTLPQNALKAPIPPSENYGINKISGSSNTHMTVPVKTTLQNPHNGSFQGATSAVTSNTPNVPPTSAVCRDTRFNYHMAPQNANMQMPKNNSYIANNLEGQRMPSPPVNPLFYPPVTQYFPQQNPNQMYNNTYCPNANFPVPQQQKQQQYPSFSSYSSYQLAPNVTLQAYQFLGRPSCAPVNCMVGNNMQYKPNFPMPTAPPITTQNTRTPHTNYRQGVNFKHQGPSKKPKEESSSDGVKPHNPEKVEAIKLPEVKKSSTEEQLNRSPSLDSLELELNNNSNVNKQKKKKNETEELSGAKSSADRTKTEARNGFVNAKTDIEDEEDLDVFVSPCKGRSECDSPVTDWENLLDDETTHVVEEVESVPFPCVAPDLELVGEEDEESLIEMPRPQINLSPNVKHSVHIDHATMIVSPGEFYIAPMALRAQMVRMHQEINKYYAQIRPPLLPYSESYIELKKNKKLEIGHYALYYDSDDNDSDWVRARVIDWRLNNLDELVKIKLIDYGDTKLIPFNNLTPLPDNLTKYPLFAIQCHLHGIYPKGKNPGDDWPDSDATRVFIKLIRGINEVENPISIMICKENKYSPKGSLPVLLMDLKQNKVNDQLVELSVAEYIPNASKGPFTPTVGGVYSVEVTGFYDTNCFYCNFPENVNKIEELTALINNNEGRLQKLHVPPEYNDIVIANYCEDNLWYRGRVTKVDLENDQFTIFFVDYSNSQTMRLEMLRQMEPRFLQLPFQSVKCVLENTVPLKEYDRGEFQKYIKTLTRVKITVKNVVSSPKPNELTGLLSVTAVDEDGFDIASMMAVHKFIDVNCEKHKW